MTNVWKRAPMNGTTLARAAATYAHTYSLRKDLGSASKGRLLVYCLRKGRLLVYCLRRSRPGNPSRRARGWTRAARRSAAAPRGRSAASSRRSLRGRPPSSWVSGAAAGEECVRRCVVGPSPSSAGVPRSRKMRTACRAQAILPWFMSHVGEVLGEEPLLAQVVAETRGGRGVVAATGGEGRDGREGEQLLAHRRCPGHAIMYSFFLSAPLKAPAFVSD